jgi:hypothetical protein
MSQSLENPVDPGRIFQTYAQVLTNPSGFFRHLPLGGGLQPAIVFLGVSGLLSGLAYFVLAMLSFKPYQSMGQALFGLLVSPLAFILLTFVSAAVINILWRFMGSGQNYRTAFACLAYISAISPFSTLLSVVPLAGSLVALAWGAQLMVVASVEVHGLSRKNAWLVFGVLGAVFYLLGLLG